MAEDTSLLGLAWSPVSDRLAGGLSDDSHTWLALWDAEGKNAGFLAEFSHPASEVLSVAYPAWSPDGEAIAFELRHWSWEEEGQYRIEIMAIPASGGKPRTLVPTEWGFDASHPSWSAEGSEVLYQLSVGEPGLDHQSKTNGYIWAIAIGDDPDVKPQPLIEDARSYLPAARPCVSCSERSDN